MSRKGENIYKRKDGRWEGRFKQGVAPNGRTLYRSCYGKTYREVKEKLQKSKQSFAVQPNPPKRNEKKSFGGYCAEWLAFNRSRVKESTIAKYTLAVNNHIIPFFGKYQPGMITAEMTAEFVNDMIGDKKLSAKTAKDTAVILKSILKYISRTDRQLELIDVAMPRYSAKEIRVLSHEEQQLFTDFLLKDTDAFKFGILFALMTGLRIGEVCALRVKDISLSDKTVTVRETVQRIKNLDGKSKTKIVFTPPKSGNAMRVVPLTNIAYELCSEFAGKYSPEAFLLTGSESEFVEPRVLQYRIKKYSETCGIEDLHFHVLRHTFATRCVEVGFEIKSLSEVLGHSTPRITLERYVHSSLEFKRQNMTKLEAIGM